MILNALAEKLKRRSKDAFKGWHFEATLILHIAQHRHRAGCSGVWPTVARPSARPRCGGVRWRWRGARRGPRPNPWIRGGPEPKGRGGRSHDSGAATVEAAEFPPDNRRRPQIAGGTASG